MSADLLREAASLMRDRARAATQGPWHWEQYRDDLPYLVGRGGDPATYAYDVEVIDAEHDGGCACRSLCHLTMPVRVEDRDHIASWHPGVTPDAADLLVAIADGLDKRGVTAHVTPAERAAFAFARAYLGRDS